MKATMANDLVPIFSSQTEVRSQYKETNLPYLSWPNIRRYSIFDSSYCLPIDRYCYKGLHKATSVATGLDKKLFVIIFQTGDITRQTGLFRED